MRQRVCGWAVCFVLLLAGFGAGAAASRPNFIFIMADDLGWADVAFHGGNAPTPNLDRLAADGVELTQHYVCPVCSPTRSALLSEFRRRVAGRLRGILKMLM